MRTATAELASRDAEIARLRARIGELEPSAAMSDRLLDRLLGRQLDDLEGLIERHSEGNPNHKGAGPGGGQFASSPGGGSGHGKGNVPGKHHAKNKRRREKKAREHHKPGGKAIAAPRREKAKPIRGAMAAATRVGKGKDARIVMADGSEPPAHVPTSVGSLKGTDLAVSLDPKAEVLATWRDEKGRPKQATVKSFDAKSAAVKFGRVSEMVDEHDAISKGVQEGRKGPRKEEADAAWLMQVQGTRPGSDTDTKARKKAYGATTLEARHVVQSSDGVRLQFAGKEGISHNHLIRDPELAKMLVERKDAAGDRRGKLFKTDEKKTNDFVKTLGSGGYTSKDFRTSVATRMAQDMVKADPEPPRSAKEHSVRVNAVAVKVSRLLGNKPAQALKSYIHPTVFAPWTEK
jgi:DNA topoisomerase-1